MQQRVTIKDIARKTGTSVTSVHRALYGRAGISESLRHRILTEVERSNYQVDEAASLLRRKQYHIVVRQVLCSCIEYFKTLLIFTAKMEQGSIVVYEHVIVIIFLIGLLVFFHDFLIAMVHGTFLKGQFTDFIRSYDAQ